MLSTEMLGVILSYYTVYYYRKTTAHSIILLIFANIHYTILYY